jgi:hypothetical protein
MDPQIWQELLDTATEFQEWFPEGVVYIGGLAVAAHVQAELSEFDPPFSHDGDFMMSLADFADFRDLEEVTSNRRLNKHQVIKRGLEFDIYVENHNSLIIPFDVAFAASEMRMGLRVLAPEHLLCLKAEAYLDRRDSVAKGPKDARDIVFTLAVLAQRPKADRHPERLIHLTQDHMDAISGIIAGPAIVEVTAGNAFLAARLRKDISATWQEMLRDLQTNPDEQENDDLGPEL